jgi:ComF family protein
VRDILNNWLKFIFAQLLPPRCLLCGQAGSDELDLCAGCLADLPKNQCACYRCGHALEIPPTVPTLCKTCLYYPPAFDRTHAPFLYQGTVAHLVTSLKFSKLYANARLLGTLLAQSLTNEEQYPDCIIPIPLHRRRYYDRGFNQSIEIAQTVGRQLQIPLDLTSCIRRRDTPHQTGLSAYERRYNIEQAFSVNANCRYRHVALLDDVMTTGATVNELAATLKQAGVERVDVWVCARTA